MESRVSKSEQRVESREGVSRVECRGAGSEAQSIVQIMWCIIRRCLESIYHHGLPARPGGSKKEIAQEDRGCLTY